MDKQSFRDFVADMLQYVEGQWTLVKELEVGGKYRDGIYVISFHSWLHDNRVNVSFEFEPFGDPELDGQFKEACVYMGDKVDGVSHPMTSARRAAGRVNVSLALYREAMERCMERRRKHEELLVVARLNAAAVVEASDGVYQIEQEDYQHRAIHLIGRLDGRSDKRAPGADDMIVTDSGVTIDKHAGWGWTIPLSLAIHIVKWMAAHKFKTPEPPVCDCPVSFEEVGEGEVFMLDDTLCLKLGATEAIWARGMNEGRHIIGLEPTTIAWVERKA